MGKLSDVRVLNRFWVHADSYMKPGLADMWSKGKNLLAVLNNEKYAKHKVKELLSGGVDIREGVETAGGTAQNFMGFSEIKHEAPDPWTQGKWDWRGIVVTTGLAKTDILKTNGQRRAVGKLISNAFKHALKTFQKELTIEIVQGNEAPDPKAAGGVLGAGQRVDGLRYGLNYQKDQADSYGGWQRNVDLWARHEVQDVGAAYNLSAGGIVDADNLLDHLDGYLLKCTWGMGEDGQITLLVATRTAMTYLFSRAKKTPIPAQIIVRNHLIDLGITCQEYNGIPLIWEPELDDNLAGLVGTEADQTIYGLNTRTIKLFVHEEMDMVMSELKEVSNQKAFHADMSWMGNLVVTEPRHNFVLFGISAPTQS